MNNIPPVVGFCGAIGAGKDFAAAALVDQLGFERHSFADPLKMAVAIIYDLPRHRLDAFNEEDRVWREQEHDRLTKQFGRSMSPRKLLQEFGTECVRGYCDNTWVEAARQTIRCNKTGCLVHTVFSDVRFPNELSMIQEEGGLVVKIYRTDGQYGGDAVANAHSSEGGIPDGSCDFVIFNHGDGKFQEDVVSLVRGPRDE